METYITNVYLTIFCIFWFFCGILTVDGLLTQLLSDTVKYRWLRITIKIISLIAWPLTIACVILGLFAFLILDSKVCKRFFE